MKDQYFRFYYPRHWCINQRTAHLQDWFTRLGGDSNVGYWFLPVTQAAGMICLRR